MSSCRSFPGLVRERRQPASSSEIVPARSQHPAAATPRPPGPPASNARPSCHQIGTRRRQCRRALPLLRASSTASARAREPAAVRINAMTVRRVTHLFMSVSPANGGVASVVYISQGQLSYSPTGCPGTKCAEKRCTTSVGNRLLICNSKDCGALDGARGSHHVCHGAEYMPLLTTGSSVTA